MSLVALRAVEGAGGVHGSAFASTLHISAACVVSETGGDGRHAVAHDAGLVLCRKLENTHSVNVTDDSGNGIEFIFVLLDHVCNLISDIVD